MRHPALDILHNIHAEVSGPAEEVVEAAIAAVRDQDPAPYLDLMCDPETTPDLVLELPRDPLLGIVADIIDAGTSHGLHRLITTTTRLLKATDTVARLAEREGHDLYAHLDERALSTLSPIRTRHNRPLRIATKTDVLRELKRRGIKVENLAALSQPPRD